MNKNYIKFMDNIRELVCEKFYFVEYRNPYNHIYEQIKGLLLNYHSGNIDLLTDKGIYHIKYCDIEFMKPIKSFEIKGFKGLLPTALKTKENITAEFIGTEYDGYANGNPVYDVWECSNCHEEFESEGEPPLYNFCPNCGADMSDGE